MFTARPSPSQKRMGPSQCVLPPRNATQDVIASQSIQMDCRIFLSILGEECHDTWPSGNGLGRLIKDYIYLINSLVEVHKLVCRLDQMLAHIRHHCQGFFRPCKILSPTRIGMEKGPRYDAAPGIRRSKIANWCGVKTTRQITHHFRVSRSPGRDSFF